MCKGNEHDPRRIKRRWEELLGKKTVEREWQRFFEEFPCALAQSLPLERVPLSFRPLARPGKREADFYFYEEKPSPLPVYGLLELKTADTRLISSERRGFPVLSTAIETGIAQLDYYARETLPGLVAVPKTSLLLGAGPHLFLIAGLEEEVAQKLGVELFGAIGRTLPRGIQLLPFDTLLRRFAGAMPRMMVMVPKNLGGWIHGELLPHPKYPRFLSDVIVDDRYTLETFNIGPLSRIAAAAASAVADDPGHGTYNPFFLYGAAGTGKTHLLQAICHRMLARRPEARVIYASCETFARQLLSALERGDLDDFRRRYRDVDALFAYDVHLLAGKERTQEEFFHTFNALYQAGKQIILSSDAPPTDIPTLEERLVSRFKWGLVEKLEQPETETRMAIIRRKAELMGLPLPNDVVEYVATNVRTNIREIEGAIASVRTRAQMEHVPVDLAIAKLALEATLRHEQKSVGIDRIAQVVATHYDVKVTDLRSKKRTKSISFPRQVVMYLARDVTRMSLLEIGEWFGGRDHMTVLYATDRIADQVAADDGFKHQLAHLKDRICAR